MRKKRLIGIWLIITALILMLLPISEADAASSASDFVIKSGKLTKYKGTEKTVTVPKTVEVIGEYAFAENDNIEKVILPDSVTSIEAYSFWGCDSLASVELGKGMIMIGDFAFTNCGGLKAISIPSNVNIIGIQAFSYCKRLEDITIPPEVSDIHEDAFEGDYLLNIHCQPGSYADKYAQDFYERQKKMSVYGEADTTPPQSPPEPEEEKTPVSIVPDKGNEYYEIVGEEIGSTKVVANQAVILMQSAALPVAGNTSGNAGGSSENGSGTADAAEGGQQDAAAADVIPERFRYRDSALKEAAVDAGILEIEPFAYARSGIADLSLPEGLERIDYAAFYHCDDLEEVKIPDSVIYVVSKAFAHTPWVEDFLDGKDDTAGDFLISGGVLVAYRGKSEEISIPGGVRVIAGEAFADHKELKKVNCPTSLQVIDREAFRGCHLESVDYNGSQLDQGLVEQMFSTKSMIANPAAASDRFPWFFARWLWIPALGLMISGSWCALGKSR